MTWNAHPLPRRFDVDVDVEKVTCCARGGNLDGALALLDEMTEAGVPPNLFTYNSAIHACAKKVSESVSSLPLLLPLLLFVL